MEYPKTTERPIGLGKLIIKQHTPKLKEMILINRGKIAKREVIPMLTHEKQLDKLLLLGLTCHPLEQDGCWGIFASTQEKAVERFVSIKAAFPQTIPIKLKGNLEGDFGVDLYG